MSPKAAFAATCGPRAVAAVSGAAVERPWTRRDAFRRGWGGVTVFVGAGR